MKEQSAAGILSTTIEKVRQLVDVSTIVGEPIALSNEITVIPVSKVSFGLAAGGGEYNGKNPKSDSANPFVGGVGAGVTVNPMAFLVVTNYDVKLIPVQGEDPYSRLVEAVPSMVNKVVSLFRNKEEVSEEAVEE